MLGREPEVLEGAAEPRARRARRVQEHKLDVSQSQNKLCIGRIAYFKIIFFVMIFNFL